MRSLEAQELSADTHWWEFAGHHDPQAFVDAWRQTHFAAQAAAELGKSWAAEKDDDSHSSLIWIPDAKLPDQYFAGVLAEGEQEARALLRPWDMRLFLIDNRGSPLAETELVGKTMAESIAWLRDAAHETLGEIRQPARPAPDLPDHPLGGDSVFPEPNQLAIAEVIRFYGNTDALLTSLSHLVEDADEPKTWPHHFDLAMLVSVARDDAGGATKTIGVGITPPDLIAEHGYWYVSPWSKTEHTSPVNWANLEHGHWVERDGLLRMAVLPTSEVTSTEDPAEQQRRLTTFIAAAYNSCSEALTRE